jgi:hypothetical protein
VSTIGAHGHGSFDRIKRGQQMYWRFRISIRGKKYEHTARTKADLWAKAMALRASAKMDPMEADLVARSADPPSETDINGRRYVRLASEEFRAWIYERDRGICGICGQPVAWSEIHVDHIRPTIEGGNNDVDNLRISHPRCNLSRGSRRLQPVYLV